MSVVTDVVMHVDLGGREDDDLYDAITEYLPFTDGHLEMLDYRLAGGRKAFQGWIFAGAFNHLNTDAMIYWFGSLPWHRDDYALMSLSTEGELHGAFVVNNHVIKALRP